jgi:mersacidin/lichenicidin family type 2 lantibiotic
MSLNDIIRAWKDADYRSSLSAAELAQLPQHPAGQIDLDDIEELDAYEPGTRPTTQTA